jgi:hypothetical protein
MLSVLCTGYELRLMLILLLSSGELLLSTEQYSSYSIAVFVKPLCAESGTFPILGKYLSIKVKPPGSKKICADINKKFSETLITFFPLI